MFKFSLGVLVATLYYNQAPARRLYYKVTHEVRVARTPLIFVGEPPPIQTEISVKEPTLDTLAALGFQTVRVKQ